MAQQDQGKVTLEFSTRKGGLRIKYLASGDVPPGRGYCVRHMEAIADTIKGSKFKKDEHNGMECLNIDCGTMKEVEVSSSKEQDVVTRGYVIVVKKSNIHSKDAQLQALKRWFIRLPVIMRTNEDGIFIPAEFAADKWAEYMNPRHPSKPSTKRAAPSSNAI